MFRWAIRPPLSNRSEEYDEVIEPYKVKVVETYENCYSVEIIIEGEEPFRKYTLFFGDVFDTEEEANANYLKYLKGWIRHAESELFELRVRLSNFENKVYAKENS